VCECDVRKKYDSPLEPLIAGVFAELERSMINSRTKAGIEKAKFNGVKFGRPFGSTNQKTEDKIERIKFFIEADKGNDCECV
jgi:DNA invertase Pin-like site-specific DNA recombinase